MFQRRVPSAVVMVIKSDDAWEMMIILRTHKHNTLVSKNIFLEEKKSKISPEFSCGVKDTSPEQKIFKT